MSDPTWAATLDDFEARLHEREVAAGDGSIEPLPPFQPPADLAPLPQDFSDRAAELVRRCRALESKLEAALDDARGQLDRLGEAQSTTAPPAQPMFFDSRI